MFANIHFLHHQIKSYLVHTQLFLVSILLYSLYNDYVDIPLNQRLFLLIFGRSSDNFEVDYIPLKKNKNTVRLAKDDDAQNILEQFNLRSEEILDQKKVCQHYDELANYYQYYYQLRYKNL